MPEMPITGSLMFTIEDFIGAIMPGMVWSVEFFTINELLGTTHGAIKHKTSVIPSTFDVAITYAQSDSVPFYAGLLICSFIPAREGMSGERRAVGRS
jgi:hypothetical protein